MGEALIKRRFVKSPPPTPGQLTPGETYSFGGYDWICAEVFNDYAVLQSKGVTGGAWPGYVMTGPSSPSTGDWGNANSSYNSGDIDGLNISGYNATTATLYSAISSAEYTNASYGEGLFLIPKSYVDSYSGNYYDALLYAASHKNEFEQDLNSWAWLGKGGNGYAYFENSGGIFDANDQNYRGVLAPAFNVDISKINLSGNTITVK